MLKRWQICWIGALLLLAATSASAQIEKVVMKTDGLACVSCEDVDEIHAALRHLDGVGTVALNVLKEQVSVSYKDGDCFRPRELRDALRKNSVVIDEFQITARGQVLEEGGNKFFVTGKLKFKLVPSADVPPNGSFLLQAVVNDQTDPMELDVISSSPLKGANQAGGNDEPAKKN